MNIQNYTSGERRRLSKPLVAVLASAFMVATLITPAHATPAPSGPRAPACNVWADAGVFLTDVHNDCPQAVDVKLIFWTVVWGEFPSPPYCIHLEGGEVKTFWRGAPSTFRRIEWC
jgi:hypothetical protein